jgi:hypothetical protein
MANQDINISKKLLNRFNSDLTAVTRLIAEAMGMTVKLKSLLEELEENQEFSTER